jgi:hypothetical protein
LASGDIDDFKRADLTTGEVFSEPTFFQKLRLEGVLIKIMRDPVGPRGMDRKTRPFE